MARAIDASTKTNVLRREERDSFTTTWDDNSEPSGNHAAFLNPTWTGARRGALAPRPGALVVLLGVRGNLLLLSTHHARVASRLIDPHRLVPDPNRLRFSAGCTSPSLLGRRSATEFSHLNSLRLRTRITRAGSPTLRPPGRRSPRLLRASLLWVGAFLLRGLRSAAPAARRLARRSAALPTRIGRILVLRTADLAILGVLVSGQFEITNHPVLGFFFYGLGRTIEQSRVRERSLGGAAARRGRTLRRRTGGGLARCRTRCLGIPAHVCDQRQNENRAKISANQG